MMFAGLNEERKGAGRKFVCWWWLGRQKVGQGFAATVTTGGSATNEVGQGIFWIFRGPKGNICRLNR